MIPGVLSLKVAAITGAAAFLVGSCAGAGGARLFYAPRLELERQRVATLGEDLRRQNKAVEKLAADGRGIKARAAAAVRDSEAARAAAEKDALLLLQIQPKPGENRCDAASALIRKELAR